MQFCGLAEVEGLIAERELDGGVLHVSSGPVLSDACNFKQFKLLQQLR